MVIEVDPRIVVVNALIVIGQFGRVEAALLGVKRRSCFIEQYCLWSCPFMWKKANVKHAILCEKVLW